jgi:hypothetical protein
MSLVVSVLALFVSGLTAWLTLLRRGTVLMTRPTVVYFGQDGGSNKYGLKIYFRALLYATSRRGCIVEGMYVRLRRRETIQNFNIWVYGEDKLRRGSGLFVSDSGFSSSHHFLLPKDGTEFSFLAGSYVVETYASIVGEPSVRLLNSVSLTITPEQAEALKSSDEGLYFDWGPEVGQYHSHLEPHPKDEMPPFVRELFK